MTTDFFRACEARSAELLQVGRVMAGLWLRSCGLNHVTELANFNRHYMERTS